MTHTASEERIALLEANLKQVHAEQRLVLERGPEAEVCLHWDRHLTWEEWASQLKRCGPAAQAMLWDSVEVRLFVAERQLVLAKHGFHETLKNMTFQYRGQPEHLGVLFSCAFWDRLGAVDPSRNYDAMFRCEETCEVWWYFRAPKAGVKRWLKRQEQLGIPWSPERSYEPVDPPDAWDPLSRDVFKQIRRILYPHGAHSGKSSRRHLTAAEAHEALRAAMAEIDGEPPHAISMLMKLDVDNLTPVQALNILKQLQDVARRRDFGPRLLDNP